MSKGKKKKKRGFLGKLIILLIILIALFYAYTKGFRIIRLLEAKNKVTYDRAEEKNVPVYDNMIFMAGDALTTGKDDSSCTLMLDLDKCVFVEQNSKVTVEAAGFFGRTKTKLHLSYGAALTEIDYKLLEGESFEVESPNSIMAVRGTKFRVSTYKGVNDVLYTRTSVFQGKVECWLRYPDGTISKESRIAEPGKEILMYYDADAGVTDFADSNDAGGFFAGSTGDYERKIDYSQFPKQLLVYMYGRVKDKGISYESITNEELGKLAGKDTGYFHKEPELEGVRKKSASDSVDSAPLDNADQEQNNSETGPENAEDNSGDNSGDNQSDSSSDNSSHDSGDTTNHGGKDSADLSGTPDPGKTDGGAGSADPTRSPDGGAGSADPAKSPDGGTGSADPTRSPDGGTDGADPDKSSDGGVDGADPDTGFTPGSPDDPAFYPPDGAIPGTIPSGDGT